MGASSFSTEDGGNEANWEKAMLAPGLIQALSVIGISPLKQITYSRIMGHLPWGLTDVCT